MAENGSYGRELALRAHELLTRLEPHAKDVSGEAPSEGSLYPTFLLSMAMPIIIQPYERIFKNTSQQLSALTNTFDGYSQESKLAKGLKTLRNMESLCGSPLFSANWAFARLKPDRKYKLADGMTSELKLFLETSGNRKAKKRPRALLEHLRHALAHGSIVYLNADWKPSLYGPVEHFLFANARPNGSVDFALISVQGFQEVITEWADWLSRQDYEITH